MVHPAQIIGKFVQNPIANRAIGGTALAALQTDVAATLTSVVSQPVYSTAAGGTPINVWKYTLLEYVPGLVSVCPASTADGVLTGWMSGCYLFRYQIGDKRYVAHVGTEVGNAANTAAAKSIWTKFIAGSGAFNIVGGSPAAEVPVTTAMAVASGQMAARVAGYFEPNGSARIVTFGQNLHHRSAGIAMMKIVAVDSLPLRDWGDVQHDKAFSASDDDT